MTERSKIGKPETMTALEANVSLLALFNDSQPEGGVQLAKFWCSGSLGEGPMFPCHRTGMTQAEIDQKWDEDFHGRMPGPEWRKDPRY